MVDTSKDTIYIDIDDEITGIIDKVRSSNGKIVALVLPKRATVFQSVVNMKLLKRATEQARKRIVLITTESSLLPLAGAVGIHVATSLASKPTIPTPPLMDDGREERVEETASLEDTPAPEITTENAGFTPVGELAGIGAAAIAGGSLETINMGEDEAPAEALAAGPAAAASAPYKPKKDKKLKVPNFERFRLVLIIALLSILIIGGAILASSSFLSKAVISIQTDASNVNASVNFTLDTTATVLDASTNTVPTKQLSEQKTYTATVPTTGQQNNGQTATGTVMMNATECSAYAQPADVPAGTGISANGQTYITQSDTSFSTNNIQFNAKTNCFTFPADSSTGITAQKAGSVYNTSSGSTNFTVAGRTDVAASGSASGGTDNVQQVVLQSDIDNAQSKITTQNNTVKQDLTQQLQQANYQPLNVTFIAGQPTITPSTPANGQAATVTVTETINYTMDGVVSKDLATLLNANIDSQVNSQSQGILNNGLAQAVFSTTGNTNDVSHLTMSTTAEVGPNINIATLKQQAAGKKSGDVETLLKSDPNVTAVSVKLSPFWITTVPSNPAKVSVIVAKPKAKASNASSP